MFFSVYNFFYWKAIGLFHITNRSSTNEVPGNFRTPKWGRGWYCYYCNTTVQVYIEDTMSKRSSKRVIEGVWSIFYTFITEFAVFQRGVPSHFWDTRNSICDKYSTLEGFFGLTLCSGLLQEIKNSWIILRDNVIIFSSIFRYSLVQCVFGSILRNKSHHFDPRTNVCIWFLVLKYCEV